MPADSSTVPEEDVIPATSFAALGVPAPLVDTLDGQGITAPFPVQTAVLPDALAGRDILGRAQTGSGKTLGFSLPMVTRLAGTSAASGRPRGLVLVPTRELATQVTEVLRPLARAMGLRVVTIYGGVSYGPQVNALQHRTEIVVATPGRLADLIGQGECDLSDVQVTVIDEADQMADLGFLPIVRRLLETTPQGGQRMLFSATLDAAVDVIARRFLSDPALHSVDENSSPAEIEHHVLTVDGAGRIAVISALAGGEQRSLVFTKTKHGAERLARQLTEAGIPAAELHGNLRQGARSRNLAAFASGLARVMVATDIAARGIHIDGIDLVIHADPPAEYKSYLHRSGRTARGGADGVVVTLQTKGQVRDVTAMMRKAGITPRTAVVADAAADTITALAGPPAPRVAVDGKVSELVQPEDRLVRNDRPGVGKPWEGRPRRDRGGDRKPGERRAGSVRSAGDGRPARFDHSDRSDRYDRGNQGERVDRGGRGEHFSRGDRDAGAGRGDRNDGANRGNRDGGAERFNPGDRGNQGDRRFDRDDRNDRGQRYSPASQGGRDLRGGRSNSSDRANQGDRRFDRPAQGDRFDRGDRAARNERGGYDWWPRGRDARGSGDDRPNNGERSGRPQPGGRSQPAGRSQSGGRPQSSDRPQASGRPQSGRHPQSGGQSFRPRSGGNDRPQAGGHAGGSSRRPGYSAGRGPAGKRRG